jgi:trimethylamine--corrinoid protein Co-methyltransferase
MSAAKNAFVPADLFNGAGSLYASNVYSMAQLVLDCEIFNAVARWAQGFTFDDEHLGLDIIEEVGPTGHFLASRHTRDHMGEFWRAKHMDSSSWEQWEAAGSPDAVASAEAEVRRILAEHEPEPLEDPVTTELRRIVAAYEAEARADAEDDED